jgi:transcriptional regulator with XRE-family HTH domain
MAKKLRASKQEFSNRVKALRAKRSVTATSLAKQTEVSPASVWQWEHAGALPRRATLSKLASALGVSTDYLLTGSDNVIAAPKEASVQLPTSLDDMALEVLVREIESRGFKVTLKTA